MNRLFFRKRAGQGLNGPLGFGDIEAVRVQLLQRIFFRFDELHRLFERVEINPENRDQYRFDGQWSSRGAQSRDDLHCRDHARSVGWIRSRLSGREGRQTLPFS